MMKKPNWTSSLSLVLLLLLLLTPSEVVATWWFISQLSAVGTRILCDNIPGLVNKQRELCRGYPDIMLSIAVGAKQGVSECQYQFKYNRWNCSTPDRDTSVFGKTVQKRASREAAFAYSISSAGVVHAITRSCSRGELLDCACDPTKRGQERDDHGIFDWGGCSDNVKFAMDFARKFIDARENKERDPRALMNLHNNKAGRRAVRRIMKLECKCHGVSGSCTIRTCWLAMMDFRQVGKYLKAKYHEANRVNINQEGTQFILPATVKTRTPSKVGLVYFERSPDYCRKDIRTGSLGTTGRICNKTSDGPDGCDVMCCGRGYNTKRVQQTQQCECKFHWCCNVKCQECTQTVDINTCKGWRNDRVLPVRSMERSGDRTTTRSRGNSMYKETDAVKVIEHQHIDAVDTHVMGTESTDHVTNSSELYGLEAAAQTSLSAKTRKLNMKQPRDRNRPNRERERLN